MPKWFLLGFIKRIENFKKKSLCDLKLKTEKFENMHTQKKKKEKIRKKRKEKEKQIHVGAKEQKRRRKI